MQRCEVNARLKGQYSRQPSETVFGSDALLKIKGWVPMSPRPLLMRSLKTTTLHGCMIMKTKTQDAPY
jgi:hypothetical protein